MNDDPRIEAQPLFVSGVSIGNQAPRDIVYVCTMANNVWAFDADTGQAVWSQPVNLGPPLDPGTFEIQLFDINKLWGILSTPVIDLATSTMYIVCWTSPDGSLAKAQFQLHALNIATGQQAKPPITSPDLRPFTTRTATPTAKTTSRTTISVRRGRSRSPA